MQVQKRFPVCAVEIERNMSIKHHSGMGVGLRSLFAMAEQLTWVVDSAGKPRAMGS